MTPRELFLANLDTIRKAVAFVARRRRLDPEEREEFESYVKLELMRDDYAVLRKFRGDSKISTYLATVVNRCFLDYRQKEWGRWRPSAAARRLGSLAMELERLLYRDGRTFQEAARTLIQTRTEAVTEEQLEQLYTQIPVRQDERVLGEERLESASGEEPELKENLIDRPLSEAVEACLNRALAELDAEDRLVLRMHFVDEMTIAGVARALGLSPASLYPRVYRIYRKLRRELRQQGISRSRALRLLRSRYRLDLDFDENGKEPDSRPSKRVREH